MKKTILILTLILSLNLKSQSVYDSLLMFGEISAFSSVLKSNCNFNDFATIYKKDTFIFLSFVKCERVNLYEIIVDTTIYFVNEKSLDIKFLKDRSVFDLVKNSKNDSLKNELRESSLKLAKKIFRDKYIQFLKNKIASNNKLIADEEAFLKKVKFCKTKGLIILETKLIDESEYTEGTNFKLSILNPTSKTIKYITITLIGLNPVNDPVKDKGTIIKKIKCVGPIESANIGEYLFENVWFTDMVEYFKISSIIVQYMDNTSKIITDANAITLSEDEIIRYFQE